MKNLNSEDIGPTKELEASLPDGGGITVLLGPNDCGKTEILRGVNRACGGTDTVTARDGALKGTLSVAGVELTVSSRIRTVGKLEVETIVGKYELSDLIDPPIKDPVKADAVRIKVMLGIKDATVSTEALQAAIGEDLAYLISDKVLKSDNLVDGVAILRRDLQAAARDSETEAENARGRAKGLRQQAEGIDLDAVTDATVLQDTLEAAISHNAQIGQQRTSAQEAEQTRLESRCSLDAALAGYIGPSIEEAEVDAGEVSNSLREAREKLKVAQDYVAICQTNATAAETAVHSAQQTHTTVATLRDAVASSRNLENPTDEAIEKS